MIELSSSIEGKHYQLYKLEQLLKPLGYSIGGNWDYDHGYFDYKIDDEVGYQFLRVPFKSVDGQLDSRGATVEFGKPFLLAHKYQRGLDDDAAAGDFSGTVNQFQEPEDPDASIPDEYIAVGQELIKELENVIDSN